MKSDSPKLGGYANLTEGTNRDTDEFIITENPNSPPSLYPGVTSPSAPYAQQGNEVIRVKRIEVLLSVGRLLSCGPIYVNIYHTFWISASYLC